MPAATESSRPARPVHHRRTSCRACGGNALRAFLSLGPMPLANAFLRSPAEFSDERAYPLDVYFCDRCALVQLLDVIAPEVLFHDYIYVTGTSETMAAHNAAYARTVTDLLALEAADLVVEVASNDGSLLSCFARNGVRTLGVEPATTIAEIARGAGIETVDRFFDAELARELRLTHGAAKAVVANNVLAHVDDTQGFLSGCRDLVAADGLVVVEVPYLRELVDRLEYDTVYHEHLCYFSVSALARLFEDVGLSLVRVDQVPVHGGSLRLYAARRERVPEHAHEVIALVQAEVRDGLTSFACFERLAERVQGNRRALVGLLRGLRAAGHSLAAYGAPAKGNTLLNYCGIDVTLVPYTVDKSPLKVGTFTPGTHLPVRPVTTLREERPDFVLVLAWNFADEIMRQQREYRQAGGRFILPLPQPLVV